jgi:hypothetical protein
MLIVAGSQSAFFAQPATLCREVPPKAVVLPRLAPRLGPRPDAGSGSAVASSVPVAICPAWKKWGTAKTVKPGTTIIHSRADDVVPFADSVELTTKSGLPESALIEVGQDHRLADQEPLEALLRVVEGR